MHKWVIRIIALLLCGVLLLGLVATVFAEEVDTEEAPVYGNIITIHTLEEFLNFAENCRLDTFSENLHYYLETDIDLTGTDFSGIPSFSGTFVGNGHTISGLELTDKGSYQGLFRYLTETAVVTDLTVTGTVTPAGSRSFVGGIAGSNAGTIRNCSFVGDVSGAETVGGIAGINTATGIVDTCQFGGTLHGNHFVGGIAGENRGKILNATNNAQINTTEIQNSVDLEDITVDSLTDSESSVTITDIGGIAGTSSGQIIGSINNGPVGYRYMGYNIGGIVGTNTGYVSECVNYGCVHGRKEVGGIVGQLEPYTTLAFSTDTVQILQQQVDDLSQRMDTAMANTKENIHRVDALVSQLEQYAADLEDAVDALQAIVEDPQIESLEDVVTTMETIEGLLAAIRNCLEGIDTTTEELYAAIKDTTGDLEADFDSIYEQVDVISSTLDNASEDLGGTIVDVSDNDTQELTSSEVANCHNQGEVLGDLNVGGIVGAICIENDLDPEEDVDILGEATLNYETEVRSVITGCVNTATVQGRKYRIGGIVGWMSMGLTRNCANSGHLSAETADYVGGIAGFSDGFIRSSSAKCRLSGDAYVGGIAGAAQIVSHCSSLTQIMTGSERLGGVVGYAESREEIAGNLYLIIGEDRGGIDGISYTGAAEPASLEQLLARPGFPEQFQKVMLRFYRDEHSYTDVIVTLGDGLHNYDIPVVPTKDGAIGVWEGLEDENADAIYFDHIYRTCYDSVITAIEGDLFSGDRAVLMAQGQFTSNQNMVVQALPGEDGWTFHFPNGGVVEGLRLLLPENWEADSLAVMLRNQSGEWESVPFESNGSYLVFAVDGSHDAVRLVAAEKDNTLVWVAAVAAGVIVVTIAMRLMIKKARKRKGK